MENDCGGERQIGSRRGNIGVIWTPSGVDCGEIKYECAARGKNPSTWEATMADRSEAAKTDDRHPKKIKEVIVKYEENGQPGVMILTHESQGHFVDAIVFENHGSTHSKRLIDRLGLEDNGKFSPINIVTGTRPGHKKWKVEVVGAGVRTGHCIWVHDEDCLWSENCGPEREA